MVLEREAVEQIPREERLDMPGVYLILFEDPWAVYVGCTDRSFSQRWDEHSALLASGKHKARPLMTRIYEDADEEGDFTLRFMVWQYVTGSQIELLEQEARCLKLFLECFPLCEILNDRSDWIWKRAKAIDLGEGENDDERFLLTMRDTLEENSHDVTMAG